MMNNNLRPLSTFERFFWLHDQIEPVHFAVSAQVEGATTIEEWKVALSSLQRRHPLLRVSIQTDEKGIPFFREEPTIPIPLRIVEGNAVQQLEMEIAREISTPFYSSSQAPLVRATLLHEERRCIVILVAHHSIVDAISLTYAIRDLLNALAGKPLEPLPVPASHEQLLGINEDSKEEFCQSSGVAGSINPIFFELVPSVTSLRLSKELTGRLRERAQQEQTSIHGALAASIVFAAKILAFDSARPRLRLGSPISTRKLLNQGDTCSLLTDIGMQDLSFPDSGDFWQLARHVRNDLSPQQSLDRIARSRVEFLQIFANAPDAETTIQIVRQGQGMDADFVLSNMGNLSFEREYGTLRLEAVWGPAILIGTFENQQVLGVATVNGKLSLLYCSHTPIPHLLEALESVLVEHV